MHYGNRPRTGAKGFTIIDPRLGVGWCKGSGTHSLGFAGCLVVINPRRVNAKAKAKARAHRKHCKQQQRRNRK